MAYKQAVIDTVASNPNLFHYLLQEYNFWFMPAFSGKQPGH
jgi:hypothetical protein